MPSLNPCRLPEFLDRYGEAYIETSDGREFELHTRDVTVPRADEELIIVELPPEPHPERHDGRLEFDPDDIEVKLPPLSVN